MGATEKMGIDSNVKKWYNFRTKRMFLFGREIEPQKNIQKREVTNNAEQNNGIG